MLPRWPPRARSSSTSAAARSPSATPTRSTSRRAGYTKLDLVRYFVAVADGALRGVRGRPMALKRFVDGTDEGAVLPEARAREPPGLDARRHARVPVRAGRPTRSSSTRPPGSPGWPTSAASTSTRTPSAPTTWTTPTSCGWTSTRCPACPGRRCARSRWSCARCSTPWASSAGPRLGLARDPRQRPHRAPLDVPAGPAGGAGAGPGRGAAGAVHRHLQVVEGGAPRRLPRLQPERQGPDRRVRLLRPADARCAGLVPAPLGRGGRRGGRGLHAGDGARRCTPRGATPAAGIDAGRRLAGGAAGALRAPRGARARATRRGRPTTRSRRASRRGSSRRASAAPTREYAGRGVDGGPPPEVAEARAAAVAAGDPNAGLPTEWEGSRPGPRPPGRRSPACRSSRSRGRRRRPR